MNKKQIAYICDKRGEELMQRRQELRERYIQEENRDVQSTFSRMIKILTAQIEETQILKNKILELWQ